MLGSDGLSIAVAVTQVGAVLGAAGWAVLSVRAGLAGLQGAVSRLEGAVRELNSKLSDHGERIARIEAKTED